MSKAVDWQGDRVLLTCHLQPGARNDAIVGLHGDALKIRITAPPVEGKANRHLLQYLAKLFQVRQQDVELLSGETSRAKRVAVHNVTQLPEQLKSYL